MSRLLSASVEETLAVGRRLAATLAPSGTLLLDGELGAGKTVLARGVALGLGIDGNEVQSPSFILMRRHRGTGGELVHVDLYRLEPGELADTGIEEALAGPGVKVVEWAERLDFEVEGALRAELVRGDGESERWIDIDDGTTEDEESAE